MRLPLVIAVLAATATSPALAEAPAPQLPPEILDGRMLDQLGNVAGVLTKALLNLPVGEVQAAIENRPVTPKDRQKTVATEMGADARTIDKDVERGKVAVKQGGQALVRALPVITRELSRVGEQLDRAVANMPSPAYPKR
jgi:hypothetical protein